MAIFQHIQQLDELEYDRINKQQNKWMNKYK